LISRVEEAQQKLNAKLIVDKGANAEHPKEDNPDSDNESRPEDKLLPDKESEPGMPERSQHIQNAALSAAADETAKTTVMSDIKFGCICSGLLLIFFIACTMIFWALEKDQGWSIIDAWYFVMVTANTVGYGVLVPSNDTTRVAVVLFIVFGMAFSVFTLSLLTEIMLRNMEEYTTRSRIHEYTPLDAKVLGMTVLLVFMIAFGVVYGVVIEQWNFIESLYFTVVTMSTVGYGDYAPSKQENRLAISLYTLFAGGTFAAITSFTIASYVEVRKRAISVHFLFCGLNLEEMEKMPKDENGLIGRAEFLGYMLIQMGYVDELTLQMINDCFTSMDANGSGDLSVTDIVSAEEGEALLKYMRRRYGINQEDAEVMPVGIFGLRRAFSPEVAKMSDEQHREAFAQIRSEIQGRKNKTS